MKQFQRIGLALILGLASVMLFAACEDDAGDGADVADTEDGVEAPGNQPGIEDDGEVEEEDEVAEDGAAEDGAAEDEAAALPGEGETVQPARATWNTGYFQAAVYSAAMEDLGYTLEPVQELDNPVFYQSVAQGDVDFWANGWFPLHEQYRDVFEQGAELAGTVAAAGALEGYLVNAEAVDELGVDDLGDLRDPAIAEEFDADGDGLADLYGCPPGWGCNTVIEFHLQDLGLTETVEHLTGGYSAQIADAIARLQNGENILFYTWTPNWTVARLVPGEDVFWIELPEPSYPDEVEEGALTIEGVEGCVGSPCLMGFPANDIMVVANSEFLEENPAAARMLELIQIPLDDIFAQNALMQEGEDSQADIDRHAREWIEENQEQWDSWLQEAISAATVASR